MATAEARSATYSAPCLSLSRAVFLFLSLAVNQNQIN